MMWCSSFPALSNVIRLDPGLRPEASNLYSVAVTVAGVEGSSPAPSPVTENFTRPSFFSASSSSA